LEVDFDDEIREGGVELVYTIRINGKHSFDFTQYNSQLGVLSGEGSTTAEMILLNYKSEDGSFGGFEALEKIDKENYHLRGTLSLNGMPSSVLEAVFRRVESVN
jgi:hypothetical protein